MINIAPSEYICRYDSSDIPAVTTSWTLTSADATVWGPAITTGGIVSFTSGAVSVATTVFFPALSGIYWAPLIDNTGIVRIIDGALMNLFDTLASLVDSNGVYWMFYVTDDGQVALTTGSVMPTLLRYPAFSLTYVPTSDTDTFAIHSVRLDLTMRRRSS